MYQKGRAWLEINLTNLKNNVKELSSLTDGGCLLMPVLKADAYGHCAVIIGKALQEMGISDFCVASLEEGIQLREYGITGNILVLGYTHPSLFSFLYRYQLTQAVIDYPYARLLSQWGKPLTVHVAVDTGMHRIGERFEHKGRLLNIWKLKNLRITGVFSHLCVSDSLSGEAMDYTHRQLSAFLETLDFLHANGLSGFKSHILGSYGLLNYPEYHFDYVRCGIALYGILSSAGDRVLTPLKLSPVLSLKARITSVRTLLPGEAAGYGLDFKANTKRTLGAVSIGYADGLPRSLGGRGYALVEGICVPIAGRICMDQLLLDLSDVPDAAPGKEAVFIGKSRNAEIRAEEMASWAGTISNELVSRLGSRLYRIPVGNHEDLPCLLSNHLMFQPSFAVKTP